MQTDCAIWFLAHTLCGAEKAEKYIQRCPRIAMKAMLFFLSLETDPPVVHPLDS